jgi:phage terminase large subunit
MQYQITTSLKKIANLKKKIRAVQGGTSSSKTISILLYLIDLAQKDKTPTLTSIISESLPHLKRGVIRDFKNIMKGHHYWKEERWSETNKSYEFETRSEIEFFPADDDSKLRGGRRDRAFLNEVNNLKLEAFDEIEVRTKEFIFLDWNPTSEFWFYTEIKGKRDDVDFIILNYLDNEACPPEIRASIEARKNRKGWWQVYGLGQLGEIEGKIYSDWQLTDEIPHEARLERRGLDFGYTNDPTAIVDIYYYNGAYILNEVCYQKGLLNKPIADVISNLQNVLCIADSAEPKSIDELRLYGVNILPASKGPGSIKRGIAYVQQQKIFVTKQSTNLIKEYRNYLWATDKDGKITQEPEGGNDHCLDAVRYALDSIAPKIEEDYQQDFNLYSHGYR